MQIFRDGLGLVQVFPDGFKISANRGGACVVCAGEAICPWLCLLSTADPEKVREALANSGPVSETATAAYITGGHG